MTEKYVEKSTQRKEGEKTSVIINALNLRGETTERFDFDKDLLVMHRIRSNF